MIDIIELAKKVGAYVTDRRTESFEITFFSKNDTERFTALCRQALIDSGELVDKADAVDAERYRWLKNYADNEFTDREDCTPVLIAKGAKFSNMGWSAGIDEAIDRARSAK